ncbi:hypothetical protein JZ751_014591 [Albula glossodonta]|uniref:Uncharacterized protein n=1 Tax=Albula glossodonta TaxID=121402 RepID=A0A8T2MXQ6_9TELE|nr:hypothetical protein JZ751_014591 [Albula glossodonta]
MQRRPRDVNVAGGAALPTPGRVGEQNKDDRERQLQPTTKAPCLIDGVEVEHHHANQEQGNGHRGKKYPQCGDHTGIVSACTRCKLTDSPIKMVVFFPSFTRSVSKRQHMVKYHVKLKAGDMVSFGVNHNIM